MTHLVPTRFWVEVAGALTGAVLTVVTLISREWIELVLGVDPDHGSGLLEWEIVSATASTTVLFSLLARRDRRRAAAAGA
jgi:hypothetical protein